MMVAKMSTDAAIGSALLPKDTPLMMAMRPLSQVLVPSTLAFWWALQTASLLSLLLLPPTAQTTAVGNAREVKMLTMFARRTILSYGIEGCRVAKDSMPYLRRGKADEET